MYKADAPFPGAYNATRVYSPLTFSREWPTLGRLIFIVICAVFGTIINGFFVSAFFVEHSLKRIGNVFHACVGMADMILTSGVMPISAVVLLSGQWDIFPVCQVAQFLSEAASYCYMLFYTLVAAEDYYRLCRKPAEYESFLSMRIGLVAIMVFVVAFVLAGVGTYLGLDYDYCERQHFGDFYFRCATSVIFNVVPFIITLYCLIASYNRIRTRARTQLKYRRCQQFGRDLATNNLNIAAYIFYAVIWAPYLIIVHQFPDTSDSKYYHSAWIGVGRSLITSCLYFSLNRSFRCAFAQLFDYCCCKSTLTTSFANRHRRGLDGLKSSDIRVHIMHQVVNMSPRRPQRGPSNILETHDL